MDYIDIRLRLRVLAHMFIQVFISIFIPVYEYSIRSSGFIYEYAYDTVHNTQHTQHQLFQEEPTGMHIHTVSYKYTTGIVVAYQYNSMNTVQVQHCIIDTGTHYYYHMILYEYLLYSCTVCIQVLCMHKSNSIHTARRLHLSE